MVHLDKTTDTILRGKITITQMKHGYRYGFDAVCLAAFVNGYLRKNKKDLSLADVGSGVGTISLILALKNKNLKISSIENNEEFIEIAKENVLKNKFHNTIKTVNYDIFNINKNLKNHFDIVVSNPPFNNKNSNKSNNKFIDVAKRIVDLEKWMEGCVYLLKEKGILCIILPTNILDVVLVSLRDKAGSFKIYPIWPNTKKSSKRIILLAKKGGISPTELLPGLKLYNNKGVESKKASLISEEGILNFY
ncbi:methyltransferase [Alphaproteobacteria bacterium]|nr:methyltransferase [Alphaproteobacteria bacterium]